MSAPRLERSDTAEAGESETVPDFEPELPPAPMRVRMEEDHYAPLGLRLGTFLLYPSIDFDVGYGDNLDAVPDGRSGAFARLTPAFSLRSDWSRHAFDADIRAMLDRDEDGQPVDGPLFDGSLRSRLDLGHDITAEFGASLLERRESPIEADLPPGLGARPVVREASGEATLAKRFNRLSLAATGEAGRYEIDDVTLADGTRLDLSDRAYDTYGLRLRAGYEVSPRFLPFVEVYADRRDYDRRVDETGIRRGSAGMGGELGAAIEIGAKLSGEFALGYGLRRQDDPLLGDLDGVTGRASLVWDATALTTLRLDAATSFEETVQGGSSGAVLRSLDIEVEHALRRHVILTARAGLSEEDFEGIDRTDRRMRASLGAVYKLSRMTWLTAEGGTARFTSSVPGLDYTANVVRVGLRLQR